MSEYRIGILAAIIGATAIVTVGFMQFGPDFLCRVGASSWCENYAPEPPEGQNSTYKVNRSLTVNGGYTDNQVAILVNGVSRYSHWTRTNSRGPNKELFEFLKPGKNRVTVIGINYEGPGKIALQMVFDEQKVDLSKSNNSPGFVLLESFEVIRP